MITLPDRKALSRGPLRAFWLAAWLTLGLTAGVLTARGGLRRGGAVGVSVTTAGALPGLLRPGLARWPYHAWNAGARRTARSATAYTAWVVHLTANASLDPVELDAARGAPVERSSRWSPRGTQPAAAYPSPSPDPAHGEQRTPLRTTYRWVRDTERPRGRWLVACLALLRWLQAPPDPDEHVGVPTETYTLY